MITLETYGYVSSDNHCYALKNKNSHYIAELDLFDRSYVIEIHDKFGALTQDELIRYT